jgi:hypothetical protein
LRISGNLTSHPLRDETPPSGGRVDLMESSEEESGLLHQVKERLSMSTDESVSFKCSVKSGRQR